MRSVRLPVVFALGSALAGSACSMRGCTEREAAENRPAPTAPWPVDERKAKAPSLEARFQVSPHAEFPFTLKSRQEKLRGRFRVAKGELDVDLIDLRRTRGKVLIDLGSIELHGDDEAAALEAARTALNWLDLGVDKPEAERERLRWATFSIDEVREVSAVSALDGKSAPAPRTESENPDRPAEREPAGASGSGESASADSAAARAEIVRVVDLELVGDLTLHDVRIRQAISVEVAFHYLGPISDNSQPTRLVVRSRKPVAVSFAVFDVRPRDENGVTLAQEQARWQGRSDPVAQVDAVVEATVTTPNR